MLALDQNPPVDAARAEPFNAGAGRELARALLDHRHTVAEVFAEATARASRWEPVVAAQRSQWDEFLKTEFHALADYLARYFGQGDDAYKQLFVGERIKALYDPTLNEEQRLAQVRSVTGAELEGAASKLRPLLSPPAWALLARHLEQTAELLLAQGAKKLRILLVGDCVHLDTVAFLVAPLLATGVSVVVDYATSKNPIQLREQLTTFSAEKFDLVFFSPFTYEWSPQYASLGRLSSSLLSADAVQAIADESWQESEGTLALLADLFECPIHVHNSSALVREESTVRRLVKTKATARVREAARQIVNQRLGEKIAAINAAGYKHLFLLDEVELVRAHGELEAGAYYHRSELQHPAVMGRILAEAYLDIAYVHAWLLKRKVVVCDLDNTLWDGVIGEGGVAHHHGRQEILRALKMKGVVLAINSKNDPANVHWQGATLSEEDFVHAAISWDPKVQGMKRIQAALNLKTKDYVFIDDRADELEMVGAAFPETLCLDANDPAVWRRLRLWSEALEDDAEMDRTLVYRQRAERNAYTQEEPATDTDRAALFESLQLQLTLSHATAGDLKRSAELINRTNQFNLEGSRTSLREVTEWHRSDDHVLLIARTADRFGDMGVTCVAAARCDADEMVLLPFVLSCRVFGYGIEDCVLGYLKQLAFERGARRVVGRYVQTAQNAPCRDFLANNGFVEREGKWTATLTGEVYTPPSWLKVTLPARVDARATA